MQTTELAEALTRELGGGITVNFVLGTDKEMYSYLTLAPLPPSENFIDDITTLIKSSILSTTIVQGILTEKNARIDQLEKELKDISRYKTYYEMQKAMMKGGE